MQQLLLILHVLTSVAVIALVLMQHGKGADMGAAFGSGASNTMFGSQGSTPFLVKLIGGLAVLFFLTSLGLNYFVAKPNNEASIIVPTDVSQPYQLPGQSVGTPETKIPSNLPKS